MDDDGQSLLKTVRGFVEQSDDAQGDDSNLDFDIASARRSETLQHLEKGIEGCDFNIVFCHACVWKFRVCVGRCDARAMWCTSSAA
jgi:hypothetical protein